MAFALSVSLRFALAVVAVARPLPWLTGVRARRTVQTVEYLIRVAVGLVLVRRACLMVADVVAILGVVTRFGRRVPATVSCSNTCARTARPVALRPAQPAIRFHPGSGEH